MGSILEMGQKLVEAANGGQAAEGQFVTDYYADDIVSIEGGEDGGDMPSRLEGIDAIRGKHAWWFDNNDMHSTTAVGPFIGKRDDQFVIHYTLDLTPKGGERMQMSEVGIYTVVNDKIAREEYLYLMG